MSEFARRITELMSGTHAIIDLDAYARNLSVLRSLAPPGAALMPVVKADGYGHGAAMCASAAVEAGVEFLGVARISEALYLREQGVTAPILVLGPPAEASISAAIAAGVTLAVGTERSIAAVDAAASSLDRVAEVHLKVDTGMRRYGFLPDDAPAAAEQIEVSGALKLDGVFTHFSSADETDEPYTAAQVSQFEAVTAEMARRGIEVRYRHMANSAGILRGEFGTTNLVRSGIATYGLSPSAEVPVDDRFEAILTLRSVVARRHTVRPGEGVAYNRTFVAERDTEAADVPVGYADGLPRNVANVGWFVIDGERCPILGRVCMDQTVAGVPSNVIEGDAVTLIGPGSSGEMTFEIAADLAGTNNYEVATRMMARVPRIYTRGGEPVAYEHLLVNERGSVV